MDKGIKYDSDKRRWSLIPGGVMNEVIDVLEFGAKKYSIDNWKKVPENRTRYYNASMRHIESWWQGEVEDPETQKSHLAHAICCLMFLYWGDQDE